MDGDRRGDAVSFFKLAEQYEMPRGRKRRWRERRDDWPGRRRRRSPRRDRPVSRYYLPIEVDAGSANRGIQTRLLGAMGAAILTVLCLLSIFMASEITLGSIFPLAVGLGSLGLSLALTMSARREEIVHQVAGELNREMEYRPSSLDSDGAYMPRLEDGSIEEERIMRSISGLDKEATSRKVGFPVPPDDTPYSGS